MARTQKEARQAGRQWRRYVIVLTLQPNGLSLTVTASPSKDAPTGGEDKAPAKGSKKRKGADEDAHDAEDAAPAPKAAKKSRKGAAGAAKKKGEEAVEEDSVKEEAIKDESENDLDG